MYEINFLIGPNLPSQYAIVNELLLADTHTSTSRSEEDEKKTSYNKTQIAIALGVSLTALAGAAWAYYDPSLLQKLLGQATPIAPQTDTPSIIPSQEPTSSPSQGPTTGPTQPAGVNTITTPALGKTDSPLWICQPYQNGEKTCVNLFSIPNTILAGIPILLSLKLSGSGSKQLTHPLSHLNSQKTGLGATDSNIWACTFSPNGKKNCVDLLTLLTSKKASVNTTAAVDTCSPTLLDQSLLPLKAIKNHIATSDRVSNFSSNALFYPRNLLRKPAKKPTISNTQNSRLPTAVPTKAPVVSYAQFMQNLQNSARHLAIRQTIQEISERGNSKSIDDIAISESFKDITFYVIEKIIADITNGKKGNDIEVRPEFITNSVTNKSTLPNRRFPADSAVDSIYTWIQNALNTARKNKSTADLYSDFKLTEEDTPILRQAIYGKMRLSLEAASATLSLEQQQEIKPYIDACKEIETGTLFDNAFNAKIKT
ncbi:MAG: hypothetical protein K2Y01_11345 [Rhabdochlamydiaceae bacterium]|nr:hypothetical protein [Rhabdochlamydiaceae bacterium]